MTKLATLALDSLRGGGGKKTSVTGAEDRVAVELVKGPGEVLVGELGEG